MNPTAYQAFLDDLVSILKADPNVLGLITLGSTADATYRDRWSDHDFWIITTSGAQRKYLDSFDWLPDANQILITVRHGASYRTVLFQTRHKVEYAVFDREEAARGKIERFEVLIDRQEIRSLAESIMLQTSRDRNEALTKPGRLENLCLLLWTAYEKHERGEILSEQRYLQFSIDQLLDLFLVYGQIDQSQLADKLDPRRRLEQVAPALARQLRRIVEVGGPKAGLGLIQLAEHELRSKAPNLAWDRALVIKQWLLSKNTGSDLP